MAFLVLASLWAFLSIQAYLHPFTPIYTWALRAVFVIVDSISGLLATFAA